MLYQPAQISPDELTGTGTVDLNDGLTVRWQPAGDTPLTAYQIDLGAMSTPSVGKAAATAPERLVLQGSPYPGGASSSADASATAENANRLYAAGTQLYTTGKVTLAVPFYGLDRRGQAQVFSVELAASALAAAGVRNGSEVLLTITQWSGEEKTEQSTASVFRGRTAPVVTLVSFPSVLTGRTCSFTGSYQQAEGDALRTVRWQLAEVDGERRTVFTDSGAVQTAVLETRYDGFLPDTDYAVRLQITTVNGVAADTGWQSFRCEYEVEEAGGSVTALLDTEAGVRVCWSRIESAQGCTVLRRDASEQVLRRLCELSADTGELRDYTAKAGHTYTWYVFPTGHLAYLSKPMVSRPLKVRYPMWAIIEADPSEEDETAFFVVAVHEFRYGNGGVTEGVMANSNSPKLQKNFTRYPTRLADSACYLQGTLAGYCGSIGESHEWLESAEAALQLTELSRSEHALFLLDPRGRCLRIVTNGPVSIATDTRSPILPQTVTLRWAESGPMDGLSVIAAEGGEFLPVDGVIFSTLELDPVTGQLTWTTDAAYDGSELSLVNGMLVQTTEEGAKYGAAVMRIGEDGCVWAEV